MKVAIRPHRALTTLFFISGFVALIVETVWARQLSFLVAGKSKADRLQEVLEGEPRPESLPAQIIQPRSGQVTWLIDQAAAAKL